MWSAVAAAVGHPSYVQLEAPSTSLVTQAVQHDACTMVTKGFRKAKAVQCAIFASRRALLQGSAMGVLSQIRQSGQLRMRRPYDHLSWHMQGW